jgi:hypothetical protein
MRFGMASAAALIFTLACGTASARDIPPGGFTVGDVVTWLQSKGYQAQIVTGTDGTAHVASASGGVDFGVYMFDCKDDRCGSMQFSAGFTTNGKFDTTRMNDWNRDYRWTRGYFDKEKDPWVEYDIDLTPGGTYELLNDQFKIWEAALARFTTQYDLK